MVALKRSVLTELTTIIYTSDIQRRRNRPPGGDFVIYQI